MHITHIFHSGFVAELEHSTLLFDWWRGEESDPCYPYELPGLRRDVPLVVFVSHEHHDHFDSAIWELVDRFCNVRYVVDRAIEDRIPVELRERVLVVDANRCYTLGMEPSPHAGAAPQADAVAAGPALVIRTLESNDAGVSFDLECESMHIYFGADLNVWWWDRPRPENEASLAFCKGQLETLPKGPRDVAFLALDPRLQDGLIGVLAFEELHGAAHIFPMHYWDDVSGSEQLLHDPRASEDLIARIHFADEYDI